MNDIELLNLCKFGQAVQKNLRRLAKRCQVGCHNLDSYHDLAADLYGSLHVAAKRIDDLESALMERSCKSCTKAAGGLVK